MLRVVPHLVMIAISFIAISMQAAYTAGRVGQVIFQNQTNQNYDLWIDGKYACTAPPRLECIAPAAAGSHMLTIQRGVMIYNESVFELLDGGVYTYTKTRSVF